MATTRSPPRGNFVNSSWDQGAPCT